MVIDELMSRRVNQGILSQNLEPEDVDLEVIDCDCLPGCTTLTYNAETSQAEFNWGRVFQSFKTNFSEFPGWVDANFEIQDEEYSIFFQDSYDTIEHLFQGSAIYHLRKERIIWSDRLSG